MCSNRCALSAILCASLGELLISPAASAQPNYLIPVPQKGRAIALNNSGQILYDTGLLTGNTFAPFPAGFAVPKGDFPGGLSQSGAVVGNTAAGDVAVYSAGTVTDLGLPPWASAFSPRFATPVAINASGKILGYTSGPSLFFYSGGVFHPININSGFDPQAQALNDSGQIVLCGASTSGSFQAFLITGEVVTDLPPGCPTSINASGQITGFTGNSTTTDHAYIWSNGKLTVLAEPLPYFYSYGSVINKGGAIVGGMDTDQSSVPFFYNGVMTDINSLVSTSDPLKSSVTIGQVLAMNDNRLLLVWSNPPAVGTSAAYLLQAPWLDVAPGPLTFTKQGVGTTSQPQTLTLTNSGTAPLPLDSISIAAGATEFSQTNVCPPSLAAGANCTVSVTFSSSAAGNRNALLNVVTNGATITVPLSAMTAITISLSATPMTPTVGQPFTITWTASPGSTCQSSGGSANDGWNATTASGSVSVTESKPGAYRYDLTCTAGSESTAQSLNVNIAAADPPSSGGGGTLDLGSLLLLAASLAWRCRPKLN
jgi:hypothetical protein